MDEKVRWLMPRIKGFREFIHFYEADPDTLEILGRSLIEQAQEARAYQSRPEEEKLAARLNGIKQ